MKADRKAVERLIKTARGQLDGILKMIEEDRYCIDISNQISAAEQVLKKANREVLKAHMGSCVAEAIQQNGGEEKLNELFTTLDKLLK